MKRLRWPSPFLGEENFVRSTPPVFISSVLEKLYMIGGGRNGNPARIRRQRAQRFAMSK
jgi:hypothetical protein